MYKDLQTNVYRSFLCKIAKNEKNPSVHEQKRDKQIIYSYKIVLSNKKEWAIDKATWVDLKVSTLSERSQTKLYVMYDSISMEFLKIETSP